VIEPIPQVQSPTKVVEPTEIPEVKPLPIIEPVPQASPPQVAGKKKKAKKDPNTPQKAVDEEWVTIKTKPKKKAVIKFDSPTVQSEFNTLAEYQLSAGNVKNKKNLKKKLKEIVQLEAAYHRGEKLDPQQKAKLQTKEKLEREIASLK